MPDLSLHPCDSKIAESFEIDDAGRKPSLDLAGGGAALSMSETTRSSTPPISHGTVINDRYEIRQSLGKGGMGEVFLAYDRSTQQPVALKIVREEARMPGDDEALRQELLARALGRATRTSAACTIWRRARSAPSS